MEIILKLPISIQPTINNDGFVITDADETDHFFYFQKENPEKMDYDGHCKKIKG